MNIKNADFLYQRFFICSGIISLRKSFNLISYSLLYLCLLISKSSSSSSFKRALFLSFLSSISVCQECLRSDTARSSSSRYSKCFLNSRLIQPFCLRMRFQKHQVVFRLGVVVLMFFCLSFQLPLIILFIYQKQFF